MKKEVKRSWLFFLWVLCFMIPIEALAQRITVEGIVTDSNGEPIIGATVIEKGNKNKWCSYGSGWKVFYYGF